MTSYVAASNVDHDGKRYFSGDPIDVVGAQAESLLKVGAIVQAPSTITGGGTNKGATKPTTADSKTAGKEG